MDRETRPGIRGFCSLYPFGAIRGVPLLRLTALIANYLCSFNSFTLSGIGALKSSVDICHLGSCGG